jgi:2-polyprenyl-6-methoxyphenol hydroxylase-like FAD-dependent oxidoreductase
LTFDFGAFALSGTPPPVGDVTEGYAPRQTVLDKILVDAAVNAGVELREECTLHDLVWEGERVTGIRDRTKGGAIVTERARLVIGADGTHSLVARLVRAPTYNTKPALTCWYAGHWSDVPTDGVEFSLREPNSLYCRLLFHHSNLITRNSLLVSHVTITGLRHSRQQAGVGIVDG